MNPNETSGKEASESNDELRARWEGANYAMTVCRNGVVNVRNQNYNEAGHIYSVRVENGEAVGCSCPHATHRGAHCKHQRAVENRPLVVSTATAANDANGEREPRDYSDVSEPTRSEAPDMGGGESTGVELL